MKALKDWLDKATDKDKAELARRARTSLAYIGHISTGVRRCSAKTAAAIERATKEMNANAAAYNEPEIITRGEINDTCRICPYYKHKCGGKE